MTTPLDIKLDTDYLFHTLADLVQINSINPTLVKDSAGETAIATYLRRQMTNIGLDVCVHEATAGRPSVVGRLRGSGSGPSLMFNGHTDTVGVDGMSGPFDAGLNGDRLFGRGAYDMKGGLAACLAAAKSLKDAGLRLAGDLFIAAVADEEYASIGTSEVLRQYRPDAAIVTEPTHLKLCLAHKGFVWLEVETIGRAAHGSRYDLGIDANLRMGRFLAELDHMERELRNRPAHRLVGPPSLHAPILQGGTGLSTYAAKCTLQIERRTVPGESESQVLLEVQKIIAKLTNADPSFHATAKILFSREPLETSAETPIAKALQAAARGLFGHELEHSAHRGWTDAALLSAAGVDTILVGPSGSGAHETTEWVDLPSVVNLTTLLAQTALNYCGQ